MINNNIDYVTYPSSSKISIINLALTNLDFRLF